MGRVKPGWLLTPEDFEDEDGESFLGTFLVLMLCIAMIVLYTVVLVPGPR